MAYRKIKYNSDIKGVYVILDMRTFAVRDLRKLDYLLSEQVMAVQIWDNNLLPNRDLMISLIEVVHQHNIPILINNKYELLQDYDFDGVHFDDIPNEWNTINELLKDKILGVTCTNDLNIVEWATKHQLDYLSFCSMFPSENNTRCVLVDRELIRCVQRQYKIPIFLAGGITPQNMKLLDGINYVGIAIVSGLMKADDPKVIVNEFYQALNTNYENKYNT
ncbi:thiamine phosphate synthase [Sphingobacterium bovistauri]|uniref:Thiamine phosphate synthase n=1 Tax=Sphingobacterium bovistauri TaxID=2781959 RepID=A0ABS7Z5K1_9SPHI|nr:thiamine phosphate synthase [Sphingobacterium bovistauri]MCA5005475.1 thiamine phosphate synthase [Sphingobacterium bovistauri]